MQKNKLFSVRTMRGKFNASKIKYSLIFQKMFKKILDSIPYYNDVIHADKDISHFGNVRRKVQSKIKYENNIKLRFKKIPNIIKSSYASRFLLKRSRKLYRNALIAPRRKPLSSTKEFELFAKKKRAIYREQKRHTFREKFQNFSRNKLLSNRAPKAAKVYITHVRKNTFVVVSTITGELYNTDKKVSSKYSCGTIGYRNKKKMTEYAREQTMKAAGKFLNYNRYTSIDIIFTSHVSYWNKKALRSLIPHPIYVRSLTLQFNRAHSFTRYKKAKRVG